MPDPTPGTMAGPDTDIADAGAAAVDDVEVDDAHGGFARPDERTSMRLLGVVGGLVLAAPCCHHDLAAQLRQRSVPSPFEGLGRHGILRERFADVLTDTVRASLLRLHGYRVEVVEFIDSAHTPRNLLIRARRTGAAPTEAARAEYTALTGGFHIEPALERLLSRS